MPVCNQHYVPQFIIENWADKNGELLRYNYKYGNSKKVTSKGIFYEKWFYEMSLKNIETRNKIEHKLNEYETEFSDFLRKQYISNFIIKTDDDEIMYKKFVAFQLSRSKFTRTHMFSNISVEQDMLSICYYLMFGFPEYIISALYNNGYSNFYIETMLNSGTYNLMDRCLLNMESMGVRILETQFDKVPFLLYENPILIDGQTGFEHPYLLEDFKYIMPIYPNIAIGITKQKCLICVPPRIVNCAFVHDVNFGLFHSSQNKNCKYIGSRLCDFDLLDCMYNVK